MRISTLSAVIVVLTATLAGPGLASGDGLGLPIRCTIGADCFIQQLPDLDPTSAAVDPWCGRATYDGHKGTDIRVLSMADIAADVAVIAAADGTVLRVRDGAEDRLVRSAADRAAIEGTECGNGVVIDHGDGLVTQYCHMKNGSLVVAPGMAVTKGDVLGAVGASGWAQFPHVHLSVRVDGEPVDPSTGRGLDGGCLAAGEEAAPLWDAETVAHFQGIETEVLALGFSDQPVSTDDLVEEGPPALPAAGTDTLIGWSWLANLQEGDVIAMQLTGPRGGTVAERALDPVDRSKAVYVAYIGRRGQFPEGTYRLTLRLVRQGAEVLSRETDMVLR